MKTEQLVIYKDIWYQVKYEWEQNVASLNFIAHQIESFEENDKGEEVPCEISPRKALEGYVKFDGCMNVQMEEGYAHFCGRYQSKQYGELFNKIYDKAKEIGTMMINGF